MSWGKKKKELKPEEAIALAKEQLAPFWFGSPPLLAGVENDGIYGAHPLDESFSQRSWLIFFVDPTTMQGESAFQFAAEFHQRYKPHQLGFLFVIFPRYAFLANRLTTERLLKFQDIGFPAVVDYDLGLSKAFQVRRYPAFLLLHRGKVPIRRDGLVDWSSGEIDLQNFLRVTDPGLPLFPPFSPADLFVDQRTIDLGRGRGANFTPPGFPAPTDDAAPNDPSPETRFPESAFQEGMISLVGKWIQTGETIATTDPQASLTLECASEHVSVVASSMTKVQDPAKISVEVDGMPIGIHQKTDSASDDSGTSVAKCQDPQLYHLLRDLPKKSNRITLRFPYANRVGVVLYAIRCGGTQAQGESES